MLSQTLCTDDLRVEYRTHFTEWKLLRVFSSSNTSTELNLRGFSEEEHIYRLELTWCQKIIHGVLRIYVWSTQTRVTEWKLLRVFSRSNTFPELDSHGFSEKEHVQKGDRIGAAMVQC